MKKTQIKDALKNVWKQLISFLSIVLVIALGTGLFLVCRMGAISTRNAGIKYYVDHNYSDIEIRATKGITSEDVEEVAMLDFVNNAVGIISVDMVARNGTARSSVKVQSPGGEINVPDIKSGRMPENEGECIITQDLALLLNIAEGDTIDLTASSSLPKLLKTYTCTVTGIMVHPSKIRNHEVSQPIIILADSSFDRETLGVDYTGILLTVDADSDVFSAKYEKQIKQYGNVLAMFGRERALARDAEIYETAREEISKGEKMLDEAKALLDEARKKIEDGTLELSTGSQAIEGAKSLIEVFKNTMQDVEDSLGSDNEKIQMLIEGIIPITEVLKNGLSIEDARELLDQYQMIKLLLGQVTDLVGEKTEQYEEALKQLVSGREELEKKQKEYDENAAKIEAAKKALAESETDKWIIFNRFQNRSFYEMREMIGTFSNIGSSFAIFFLLLGVLVCYATIGKIIDEQRKLVGTTKAIGFKRSEIFGKYLIFGLGGAAAGAIVGSVIAFFILQPIMIHATESSYTMGKYEWVFEPFVSFLTLIASSAVGLVAAYFACGKLLKKPAIRLLNGEAGGTSNKEKIVPDGQKKKSLYAGLIFRNMRDDAKRVVITVASVAGCTTLLIVGFSTKLSFDGILDRYFRDTIRYDAIVSFNADDTAEAEEKIGKALEKSDDERMPVNLLGTVVRIGDDIETVQLVSGDPDNLTSFTTLYDLTKHRNRRIPDGGVVIFSRLAEVYDLTIGDSVSILGADGVYREVTVTGIYNAYSGRMMFMSTECAKKIFGDNFKMNAYLVKYSDGALDNIKANLAKEDDFIELTTRTELMQKSKTAAKTMNIVVYVMIVMSAIMAGVVLLNLVRIQVNQKRRELIVMRINGFTIAETAGYILKENIITTLAGIIIGTGIGIIAARYSLSTVERVDLQMIREPSLLACIYSALIAFFFAAVINLIALSSIRKLKLNKLD